MTFLNSHHLSHVPAYWDEYIINILEHSELARLFTWRISATKFVSPIQAGDERILFHSFFSHTQSGV